MKEIKGRTIAFPQCTTMRDFPDAAHDALEIDGLLSSSEKAIRDKVREFMVI
jgi:hypothetical protein